jgi:hypothetical protein
MGNSMFAPDFDPQPTAVQIGQRRGWATGPTNRAVRPPDQVVIARERAHGLEIYDRRDWR